MGNDKQADGRSKFTPTGNEQGSAAVQPDGQEDTPDNRELIREEQRGGQADKQVDELPEEEHHDQQGDAPGIFSALVGDGKDS